MSALLLALLQLTADEATTLLRTSRVTLDLHDASLQELVDATGLEIDIDRASYAVPETLRFNIVTTEMSVRDALKAALKPKGLTLTIRDGRITVVPIWMTEALLSRRYNITLIEGLAADIGAELLKAEPLPEAPDDPTATVAEAPAPNPIAACFMINTGDGFWKRNPRAWIRFTRIGDQSYMDVRATEAVHKEVKRLVRGLEKFAVP